MKIITYNPHDAFYHRQGAAGYMITAGYLSFYLYSFITSVCTITAIVSTDFTGTWCYDWNYQSDKLINFWC